MKKLLYLVTLVFIFSACTFHIPYDYDDWEYYDYHVILQVEPDDCDVLLDGKFIGAAYEFSNSRAALRLSSRNHELVLKKRGYVEKVIALNKYRSRIIRIRVDLIKEKDYTSKTKPGKIEEKPPSVHSGRAEAPGAPGSLPFLGAPRARKDHTRPHHRQGNGSQSSPDVRSRAGASGRSGRHPHQYRGGRRLLH